MKEVLANTYEYNPDLKAQREKVKATDEQIMQSLSRWLPSVGVSKEKRFVERGKSSTNATASELDGVHADLNVSQNLFRGGADIAAFKMAKSVIMQARAELLNKEQEILLSAVEIYMGVLQAEEEYKLTEERLEDAKRLVDFANRRFKFGESTKTDVAQAKASLAEAQADMIVVSGNLEIWRAKFIEVTGVEAQKLVEPELDIVLPQTLDQATESAMRSNLNLVSAKNQLDQSDFNIDKVRGEKLLPEVNFNYKIEDDRQDPTRGYGGLVGGLNNITSI